MTPIKSIFYISGIICLRKKLSWNRIWDSAQFLTLTFAESVVVQQLLWVRNTTFEIVHHGSVQLNIAGYFSLYDVICLTQMNFVPLKMGKYN